MGQLFGHQLFGQQFFQRWQLLERDVIEQFFWYELFQWRQLFGHE